MSAHVAATPMRGRHRDKPPMPPATRRRRIILGVVALLVLIPLLAWAIFALLAPTRGTIKGGVASVEWAVSPAPSKSNVVSALCSTPVITGTPPATKLVWEIENAFPGSSCDITASIRGHASASASPMLVQRVIYPATPHPDIRTELVGTSCGKVLPAGTGTAGAVIPITFRVGIPSTSPATPGGFSSGVDSPGVELVLASDFDSAKCIYGGPAT